ncbi:O-antigen ligase family protein [Castellaniella caeni]|uniref:O-antigen ligase family protein n=1 Tax=Castellaniella caeni TaxID=266123 RepID=UPI000C9FC440|nr:O-antigen ligase family protein [Castellaniella caeni]
MSPTSAARLSLWMSASAAVFFLLALSVPNGYSWGAVLLLAGGLAAWVRRADAAHAGTAPAWTIQDKTLVYALAAMFLVNALAVAWHGDSGKYLDQGIRYLLVIPVLWGLRRVSLRLDWLWAGLVLGCLGAAGVAWWQVHVQLIGRAEGFVTSAIPFGDMALLMGFWCLLGAVLGALQRRFAWAGFLLLGALAGCYAFIASATRGGLVAIPLLVVLAGAALLRRETIKPVLAGLAVLVVGVGVILAALPGGQMAESRYSGAVTEWQSYTQQGRVSSNTVGPRLEAWKAALKSIPERPLLGWGHPEYTRHLDSLIAQGRANPFVATLANTHNQFIELWLHQGTLGLVAFLALLLASFWYFALRLRHADITVRVLACCGASLPAGFAAFGLTQVILGRNNGVMFFVVSLAVWWAMMRQEEAASS